MAYQVNKRLQKSIRPIFSAKSRHAAVKHIGHCKVCTTLVKIEPHVVSQRLSDKVNNLGHHHESLVIGIDNNPKFVQTRVRQEVRQSPDSIGRLPQSLELGLCSLLRLNVMKQLARFSVTVVI
jgi:hypothetical protein